MHDGHRDRMRARIINEGIEGMQPHEVLEYLLYAAIPRKDTNELAHELITKYGSLAGVFSADRSDLLSMKGMTENAALFLTSLPAVYKRYAADLGGQKQKVITRGDVISLLRPKFLGDRTESFYLLCLDAQNNVLSIVRVTGGIPAEVAVDVRKVVEIALQNKAVSVVLAHNHPSGVTEPSHEDIELTRAITAALELIKVKLIDHFIFGNNGYYSFAEDGLVSVIDKDINRFLKEGLKY